VVSPRNSNPQSSSPHIQGSELEVLLKVSALVNYSGPGGLEAFRQKLGMKSGDVPKGANFDQIISAFITKTKAQEHALPKQNPAPT
jgi:hypothetical protein